MMRPYMIRVLIFLEGYIWVFGFSSRGVYWVKGFFVWVLVFKSSKKEVVS
jgi:hypothetical protein